MLALASVLLVLAAGLCLLRLLGLPLRGAVLGLAPTAGLAVLAIATSWCAMLGLPAAVAALLVAAGALAGTALVAMDRGLVRHVVSLWTQHRFASGMLVTALIGATLLAGSAFAGIEVPISSHDGASHVEAVHGLRHGSSWASPYPPGHLTTTAALLWWTPWVDTARGTFEASLALVALGPAAVFVFAHAVSRSLLAASATALITALTYQYPYSQHLWSGWPLAAGLALALSLWAVGIHYLREPGFRWAALGAFLAAGILLTHGTEVYTGALGLGVVALAHRSNVGLKRLLRDFCLALALAVLLVSPYLPPLVEWARLGGAIQAASEELGRAPALRVGLLDELARWPYLVSTGTFVDAPVRVALLLIGVWAVFRRRRGRLLVALYLCFAALAMAFTYADTPQVHQVFALTFPWGLKDRQEVLLAITGAALQGIGLATMLQGLPSLRRHWPGLLGPAHPAAWRRAALALAAVGFLTAEASAVTLYKTLATASQLLVTYSPDDAAAMRWLRDNAQPGDLLANDRSADAGLWAPFKANVLIVAPRSGSLPELGPERLVLDNVAALDAIPEATAAACALEVRYIYRGATGTAYEARRFPSLEELRRSTSLEEVFNSGEAAIFRPRLACGN